MEKGTKVIIKDTNTIWDGKRGTVISDEDDEIEVRVNFDTEDGPKQVIQIFNKENLDMENENESLNEGLGTKEGEKEDIVHSYVYLQDLDGNEIPSWNFLNRIATAEDVDAGVICECACDHGYKIFAIEAPSFYREVVAAKEIKAEDIAKEYADFLQGKAVVRELDK